MSLYDKLKDIMGSKEAAGDLMVPVDVRAKMMADIAKAQYRANPYIDLNNPPWPTPAPPASINIDLATFKEMQVTSGAELLTALTVMMRMEGVDVENAEKVTIEIEGGKVKVAARQRYQSPSREFGVAHGYRQMAEMGPKSNMTATEIAQKQCEYNRMVKLMAENMSVQIDREILKVIKEEE